MQASGSCGSFCSMEDVNMKKKKLQNMSEADWKFLKEKFNLKEEDREWADAMMGEIHADTDRKAQELFGDRENLPEDESEVAFNDDLTHEERLAQLQVIRADKLEVDRIHANGLGVLLD